MDNSKCNLVFYYIIDPEWYSDGDELTTNIIAYHYLIESKSLDPSKRTYILLIHKKISKYSNDISLEKYKKFIKEYSGCLYIPTVEHFVVHLWLRNTKNTTDEAKIANTE
ncbi:13614_t:CDS:2 [Dentiscutata erythropus]|uniref:13614_t:CDS:1 n=1 Tax=Dentiscutata erythropus TaxID=1348616 RepID=A0A9N8WRC7_9GLOM|nr:13614_t:CDS:2 [Dentiscutata erythropus]